MKLTAKERDSVVMWLSSRISEMAPERESILKEERVDLVGVLTRLRNDLSRTPAQHRAADRRAAARRAAAKAAGGSAS